MSVSRPERSEAEDLSYRVRKEVRWGYVFENIVELGFEFGDFSIAIAGDVLRIWHEIVNAGFWMISSHHTESGLVWDRFYC